MNICFICHMGHSSMELTNNKTITQIDFCHPNANVVRIEIMPNLHVHVATHLVLLRSTV